MPVRNKCCMCKQYKTSCRSIYSALVKRAQKKNVQLMNNGKICSACYVTLFVKSAESDDKSINPEPGPSGIQRKVDPESAGM